MGIAPGDRIYISYRDPADGSLKVAVGLPEKTAPQTAISCEEFEAYLTDYLDGVLLAPLYHRWERHAALCANCSELPGQVVRTIGACYTYKQDELPIPAGLEARILQATIGNVLAQQVRAPFSARFVEWLRLGDQCTAQPDLRRAALRYRLRCVASTR